MQTMTLKQQKEARMAAKAEAKRIKELAKLGSESKQRVMGEMIVGMEPAVQEAIKRERTRELSLVNAFMKKRKEEPTITPNEFARDKNGVKREDDISTWYRVNDMIRAYQAQIERYLAFVGLEKNPYARGEELKAIKQGPVKMNQVQLNRFEKHLETDYRAMITFKLREAFSKYVPNDVKAIDYLNVATSAKGFIADVRLTRETGPDIVFSTSCIGAGGYNIQVFHYRYITKVAA